MDIPPRRGRGQPRRVPVDKEATFASHIPDSQEKPQAFPRFEPQAPQGFSVPPMPQPGFFSPIIPEAY